MTPRHLDTRSGHRIAVRHRPCRRTAPTLLFLPGYASDMMGSKALALDALAEREGWGMIRFDYRGTGESEGSFADFTLEDWLEDAEAAASLAAGPIATGPLLVVGSSMGGWLMLHLAERLGSRVAALIGIAAAPDFTEWGRTDADKARLARGETVHDPNPYGPEPTPMHPGFWADGQDNRMLDGEIALDCPVTLLHGMHDADVPWDVSRRLAGALRSERVHLTLVKDGDHRLSRPEDIALLLGALGTI